MTRPGFLLAAISPIHPTEDSTQGTRAAADKHWRERNAPFAINPGETVNTAKCGNLRCWWKTSQGAEELASSDDLSVVLHGELYPDSALAGIAESVVADPARRLDVASELHGSFALLVLDRQLGRISLVTDRLNSRKLFCYRREGVIWICTLHALQHLPVTGEPDLVGIGHSLVNGIPLNGRTPFEGVRVMERASIHEVTSSGVSSTRYWDWVPGSGPERAESDLTEEFRELLLSAVRRRVPLDGSVSLGLSGGYDSTVVLGAMHLLGIPDVNCFTYCGAFESERNDATVAREMADVVGYRHEVNHAYRDNAATVVAENVRMGFCTTRLVVETDVWRTLRSSADPVDRRTIWVGDECFGIVPPFKLSNERDVLDSLGFYDLRSLHWLREVLPRSVAGQLQDVVRDDLDLLAQKARAFREDPYAMRDYLYMDQRLPRILSWREAFAGPCGEVRNPLLDNDLLEFAMSLPRRHRLDKRLLRVAAEQLFPDLLSIERAAPGWNAGQWMQGLVPRSTELLGELVGARPSPLDSILPAQALQRVIDAESRSAVGLRGRSLGLRRKLDGARRRVRGRSYRASRSSFPKRSLLAPEMFVLRGIALRELFRETVGA